MNVACYLLFVAVLCCLNYAYTIYIYYYYIYFFVLQFLVLLIVYFNLFSIRNISFSFTCHQLCVLFPLLGGVDCVIMDFNYPTAFDYSNRQRNQRTLVKRLIRLAQSHCPLCISQWESPFPHVPHANQSINHARHNSGYWLYIIYIVYAFALALYTDHILIKIVYAPFPPLRTAFSLCNSCQNGPINCAACNSMSIELVKGINCRMKCKHTHKYTHTHGHYNWPPCIEIRQHVFMARDCETVGNLMILQVQNILPAMPPINQPHSPILYRIGYLCIVYM